MLNHLSNSPSARAKAWLLSHSGPAARIGSGERQCAVTGRPGHAGNGSPAAVSLSVKTKSRAGESGFVNSL